MADHDAIRTFYEQHPRMISSPFGGVEGVDRELLTDVLRRLEIELAGKRVLDVGCGRGYAGEVVRDLGGDYTGLDFVRSRGGFRLALGEAAHAPFADAAFDVVFCVDAFEHFPDLPGAAAEIHRVLKPGGVFFLSAPNYGNVAGLAKWVYEGLGWYRENTWAPFGRWTPQECEQRLTPRVIRRVCRAAGFRRIRCVGHGPEVGLGLFPWMDHPRTPEAVRFRLQRLFRLVGPGIVALWPGASLHLFWRIDK